MQEKCPCAARPRILVAFVLCGAFCIFSPWEVRGQQKVGYVLDVEGCWGPASNSACLKPGDSIAAGALLRNAAAKPSDGERIVVADLKGDVVKTIRCKSSLCNECRSSGTCYDPIQSLPESGSPNVFQTAFEGLMALFSAKPERFSVHRVRGAMPDAVVQISAEHIDLSKFLGVACNGHCKLVLTEITDSVDSSNWKSKVVLIDGEQANVNQLYLQGIHPGLYEANLRAGQTSAILWVLFVDSESYGKVSDEFLRVSNQMEAWGDDVLFSLKDSYLRAYLAYLNQQMLAQNGRRTQR